MEGYKLQIKNRLLAIITGKDYAWYEEFRDTNRFNNDIIDETVYNKYLDLPDRYFLPVALAYYCREINEIVSILTEQKTPMKKETISTYLGESKKRIIELILGDNKDVKKLEETIGAEYENSKKH